MLLFLNFLLIERVYIFNLLLGPSELGYCIKEINIGINLKSVKDLDSQWDLRVYLFLRRENMKVGENNKIWSKNERGKAFCHLSQLCITIPLGRSGEKTNSTASLYSQKTSWCKMGFKENTLIYVLTSWHLQITKTAFSTLD